MGRFTKFLGAGGGGLIGSVIGAVQNRRFMNESYAREDNQLQRMAADAAAAGISPVAALGASGAYSGTSTNFAPETSGKEFGDALERRYSESSALQDELTQAQINRTEAETTDLLSQSRSRTIASTASQAQRASPELVMLEKEKSGANALFLPGGTNEPPITFDTGPFRGTTPPGLTAAETGEEMFGEPGEWLQGLYNIMAHWSFNLRGRAWDYFRDHGIPMPANLAPGTGTRDEFTQNLWELLDQDFAPPPEPRQIIPNYDMR